MAERAVLARVRRDGRYDAARSRWGGTDRALAAVFAGIPADRLPDVTWTRWQTGVTSSTLVDSLDYLSTSLCYRVTDDTTAFLACWFGLPLVDESADRAAGALVAVNSLDDARRIRRRFRRLKGALADALVAGLLPATAAPFVVAGWVAGLADRATYLSAPFRALTER
jgi:hypothetical protein